MKTKKTNKSAAPAVEIPFNEAELLASVAGFVEELKAGRTKRLRITDVTVPSRLPTRSATQVRAVREKLGASQAVFAALLNVPARTVISWENGQRRPSGAALKLLDIAERRPDALGLAMVRE